MISAASFLRNLLWRHIPTIKNNIYAQVVLCNMICKGKTLQATYMLIKIRLSKPQYTHAKVKSPVWQLYCSYGGNCLPLPTLKCHVSASVLSLLKRYPEGISPIVLLCRFGNTTSCIAESLQSYLKRRMQFPWPNCVPRAITSIQHKERAVPPRIDSSSSFQGNSSLIFPLR